MCSCHLNNKTSTQTRSESTQNDCAGAFVRDFQCGRVDPQNIYYYIQTCCNTLWSTSLIQSTIPSVFLKKLLTTMAGVWKPCATFTRTKIHILASKCCFADPKMKLYCCYMCLVYIHVNMKPKILLSNINCEVKTDFYKVKSIF